MCTTNRFRVCISSLLRKNRPVGQIFGSAFFWPETIDAAADIYNGVSSIRRATPIVAMLMNCVVRFLVDVDVPWAYSVVSVQPPKLRIAVTEQF